MQKDLDTIHHIAIQVHDIKSAVNWYMQRFKCELEYQDESWAMLKFANAAIALILPEQHPNHFAIVQNDLTAYGKSTPHRDGTHSIYITDDDGNNIELLKLADNANS